jgi:hypothetical protein
MTFQLDPSPADSDAARKRALPEAAPGVALETPAGALAAVFDDASGAERMLRELERRHGVRGELMRPRAGRLLAAPWRAMWSLGEALRCLWTGVGPRPRLHRRWMLHHLAARRRAQGTAVLVLRQLDSQQQAQLLPVMALSARSWALVS